MSARFCRYCAALTLVKPASVNKVLQSVINSPRFEIIARSSSRDSLVDFIDSLFRKHPQNSCQLSHVVRLLPIYGGSLLKSDQRLLAIMKLFERERRTSITSLLSTWTPSRSGAQKQAQSVTDVLLSLEPQTIFRSCHHIYVPPGNCPLYPGNGSDSKEMAYDPHLLLGFVGQLAHHCRELKALEWVELFRSNIFSFVICCFSTKVRTIRATARATLAVVLQSVQVNF
jgi:nucleolar pre-ribosomal-associated protein 1